MDYQKPMNNLRKEWGMLFALGLSFLASLAVVLSTWMSPGIAAAWLPLPVIALSYLFVICWRNLSENRRSGEAGVLPDFGWGNRLTLLRGIMVSAMLGFLFIPQPSGWLMWIPGMLYITACAADFFDGYAARVTNHATRLGEILDMSFDGVGVLAAVLLAVLYGQVPSWYLAIGFARYLFLAGTWLRSRRGLVVYDLPPALDRRVFAGLLMGFLAVVLLPVFAPPGTHIAATLFGLPLLFGFTRDWLYVSGLINSRAVAGMSMSGVVQRWLPVVLRGLILVLNLSLFVPWTQDSEALGLVPIAVGIMNMIAATLLILGIMPRVVAIFALCGLGFSQALGPLTDAQIALAVIYTIILYIGSGAFSMWTPEDYLYTHHAGEQKNLGAEGGL